MGPVWRLSYDSVRHSLNAQKPNVASKDAIASKKGVPIKVLWRRASVAAPAAAAAAAEPDGGPAPIQET